ncbi:MAG: NTP transferase domain-containing protein [Methanosarcinaceae archaeon]|jgi:adenosylcobinamide-phosphate guanylyltransferase|nr:NTP transferase domain-containing protein [Methanosarcinaceae archaeon]
MDAIIMAGGRGTRLDMDEKPIINLCGKPLICYVIDALKKATLIKNIIVAVSPFTPKTASFISEYYNDVKITMTSGENFVGDMINAVENSGVKGKVMIIMSDLPLITSELIDFIINKYELCGKPALSVHVPISICKKLNVRPGTVFHKNGELIVPIGINILDGLNINEEQADYNLVLEREEIAINVNTHYEILLCEKLLKIK